MARIVLPSSLRLLIAVSALVLGACGPEEPSPAISAPEEPPTGVEAPAAPAPVAAVADRAGSGQPVLFVGLDGADWDLLDSLMAAGAMPHLAALVESGTGGVLLSQHPPLSPLIWTTVATGASPLEHGILDFTRFDPATGFKEPIGSQDRRLPAIWNMATWAGREVAILGLWATYPAEPVNGLLVSDRLFSFLHQQEQPPPGIVFPPREEERARESLRQAEADIGLERMRGYLPWLSEAEFETRREGADPYAHPVSALRRILIETEVYRRLAMDWLAGHQPDLTILYLQGTDSIGHVFAPYAPPRQPGISAEDFEKYRRVPEIFFREIDAILGELAAVAEARGAVLMLASDHGFAWSEGRPTSLSSFAVATAAKWHRNEGIFLLRGPGIPARPGHGERGEVARTCATLMALLGLPPGSGLAGPPLPPLDGLQGAGETVDYSAFYTPPAPPSASPAPVAEEELAKLRALGYVGESEPERVTPPAGDHPERTAGSFNNEGLILREQRRLGEAAAAFEEALTRDPDLASALWNLSDMLYGQGRDLERSDDLLARALAAGLPDGEKLVVGRAMAYQRSGQLEGSLRVLDRALAALSASVELLLFRGRYRIETGDCQGALADFQSAASHDPARAVAHSSTGLAMLCLGDEAGAIRAFTRSLELDPAQPQIQAYLDRLRG